MRQRSTDATTSCVEAFVCCVVADICSADAAVSSAKDAMSLGEPAHAVQLDRDAADGAVDLLERGAGAVGGLGAGRGAVGGLADELDGGVGLALDAGDQLAGVGGRLGGALGQLAHLVGDDGEAPAALAGAGGLDRGVERQQVGLARDVLDRLDDPADLLGAAGERGDRGRGVLDPGAGVVQRGGGAHRGVDAGAAELGRRRRRRSWPARRRSRLWTATSAWRAAPSATRAALAASSEIAWPVSPSRTCIDAHMSWNSPVEAPKVSQRALQRAADGAEQVGDVATRAGLADRRRSPPIDANVSK